ncbi:MAG: lipid biosynthesis B12-binding/radical SAM protein [Bacteroidales bacterium]
MKTILLVSANRLTNPYPVYPIGLSYLRAYLEKYLNGFSVQIFDCNIGDTVQLANIVKYGGYSYIGVSLRNVDGANSLDTTSFISGYKEIIDLIKANTNIPIIIGGAGFSIYPKAIFDILNPNYGIIGEGENSLKLLIEALECGNEVKDIEGIVCYDNEKFICNAHVNYLKSLDVKFEESLIDYYWKQSGMLNIQTKRGCPYNCIYCSYPIIDGRCVRTLDIDLIVDNIKRLKKETGVNYLFFTDSVFNINSNYNAKLAEKLIESGVNINWGAYFSPHNLTDEMLALYKASGLTHVEFGTESFSNEQLSNYGKNFEFSDVLYSSNLCLKHNIYYAHFLILGGYGETQKTIYETMENSKKIEYSVFFPYFGMRIYPGTRLQQLAIEQGVISKEDNLLKPTYYIAEGFNINETKQAALETGKAWIFPDVPLNPMMEMLRTKRNKKGVLWEYLRKP